MAAPFSKPKVNTPEIYHASIHWIYGIWAGLCFLFLGWILIGWFLCFYILAKTWNTEITLTKTKLSYKHGFINCTTDVIAWENISSLKMRRGWLGHVFGYGRLQITTKDGHTYTLPRVSNVPLVTKRLTKFGAQLSQ